MFFLNILFYYDLLYNIEYSSLLYGSVQFSRSVMSDSLQPHESQHARPPCPLPAPGVHSDSRPLSQWCHPAISFFVVPFSSCPQSLPTSESFPMSQLFAWQAIVHGVAKSWTWLRNWAYKPTYKTETDSDTEQTHGCQGGGFWGKEGVGYWD